MKNCNLFQKKKFWILVWVFGLLLLGALAFCFKENHLSVIPGNYQRVLRSDSLEGGFSKTNLLKSDSIYRLELQLRSGAPTPYGGIGFALISPTEILKEEFVDFSRYDSLRVVLATDRMPKVTLRLSVHDPLWTNSLNAASARPLDLIIEADRMFKEYTVSLSDFSVPERWFDMMGIENPDFWRHLERGMRLEVLTATGTLLGIPDAIEIKKMELFGLNRNFLFVTGLLSLVLTILCLYGITKKGKKG